MKQILCLIGFITLGLLPLNISFSQGAVELSSPADGANINYTTVEFTWSASTDPAVNDYILYYSTDDGNSFTKTITNGLSCKLN
jgi:hypothetical protein